MTPVRVRTAAGLVALTALALGTLLAGFSAQPSKAGIPPTPNVGFSVNSGTDAGPGDGLLYTIDITPTSPTFGVATPVSATPVIATNIESLAFLPDFSELVAVDSDPTNGAQVLGLDPATGEILEQHPLVDIDADPSGLTPLFVSMTGLTFTPSADPSLSNLWLTTFNPAEGVSDLYQIGPDSVDPSTFDATFVEELSETVVGLAWDGVDPAIIQGLGATPFNNLDIIDNTGLGDSPFKTDLGLGFEIIDGGLDSDPSTGTLWGIDDGSAGTIAGKARPRANVHTRGKVRPHAPGQSTLFSIDPSLGLAVDVVGVTDPDGNPLTGFDNLAIGPAATPPPPTTCSGGINVPTKKVKFGNVRVNRSKVRGVTIRNASGDEPLFITALDIDNGDFEVANGDPAEVGPLTIAPHGTLVVAIRFTPSGRGKDNATLTISISDCDKGDRTVRLLGKGIRKGHGKK